MTDNVMLTTIDNPYNPFSQWDEWFEFDTTAGHHTSALLARVAVSSDELSEVEQELAYNLAVDEIVKENVSGIHKKIYEDSVVKPVTLPPEPEDS